ncbi:Cinnamoyl-CoA reductase 2 [Ananas comosus]|uniref:Cinnamoyl-CoA reductase 2 n=1 Tax=Ananas comosus TaxID=4615 RepID=A0A199VHA7_ANACO|nr:Cinnamoyl-CoA reductase 2 [Ananas comosus]
MAAASGVVCVTGAGGFMASWVVKLLLNNGYSVHGTLRDPSDESKNAHLKKLEHASQNLQLFKADLLDYSSLASAIAGCQGVFHVASPVPASKEEVVKPAVDGTLNVLKACAEAKVRRAVVVSSRAAVRVNPSWPKGKVMDENCWSDKEYCRNIEYWYALSKTLAESEALDFGEKNGLDVVTVCPCLVIGPMLQSTVNASSVTLINLLKGARETTENKTHHIVDVRDVASALLLLYEKPEASGRIVEVDDDEAPLSSEKLQKLGWRFRPLEESLRDSVEYYEAAGLLE